MAITNSDDEMQQLSSNWQYKISGVDIELKEQQFMDDEFEYYKEAKTKSKKNAHLESKHLDFFASVKARSRGRALFTKNKY